MAINVCEKKMNFDACKIAVSISYPAFDSGEHKLLCKKMNAFYESVAEKISRRIKQQAAKEKRQKGVTRAGMTSKTALCSEEYICIVEDIFVLRNGTRRQKRFSQIWGVQKGDLLKTDDIIKTDKASRRTMLEKLVLIAEQNCERGVFCYHDGYEKRMRKAFDVSKCFAAPNGLCFYFDAGVLSHEKFGPSSFVVPFSELETVLKCDFSHINSAKKPQKTDIVNNI